MENRQLSLFEFIDQPAYSVLLQMFPDSESDEIEYKSAEGGFPSDFWKTYSAFANSKGGIVVLGIKERKSQFIIEGLPQDKIDRYKKDFWNTINNPTNTSINLLTDADVRQFELDGKTLLAFKIPAATRVQRPVYLTLNPFDNTYKRNYEGDYKCTREEVRRMLADADLSVRPDSRILEDFTMDDFDMPSIRQYRQLFASNRPGHAWLSLDDKGFLSQMRAYRFDRKTKKEGPTVAGMLMFGKSLSITDEECCPHFFPDYREILSTDPQIRWTDRILPDGNWEANLFQFYRLVWPKLSASLPKPFQLKKGVRQDETPAHTALREAFVNALIHTDYSAPGSIIIEHRSEIYRFTNPGTLLVTIDQYYQGGISECRNTSIQQMFLMIGSAEKAGSGVNKIMAGWEYAHWRSPYLTIESRPDRLVLELPKFSILPEETLQSLRQLFGEDVDSLGKDELTILAACEIEGETSNTRLQYMIDRHRTDITKILQELCKSKYLISENKNRWTTYHLNADYALQNIGQEVNIFSTNKNTSAENIATFEPNLDTSRATLDTSRANLDSSEANLDTSEANLDTSGANLDTPGANLDTPGEAFSIPTQKHAKKLSKNQLFALIKQVCADDYISLEEIAIKVDRKAAYIKNEIIPVMISENQLEKLYADNPNHPQQKYKRK